jgi:hypothetical protein
MLKFEMKSWLIGRVCVHARVYICIYICVCVYICVYIYIYMHIYSSDGDAEGA